MWRERELLKEARLLRIWPRNIFIEPRIFKLYTLSTSEIQPYASQYDNPEKFKHQVPLEICSVTSPPTFHFKWDESLVICKRMFPFGLLKCIFVPVVQRVKHRGSEREVLRSNPSEARVIALLITWTNFLVINFHRSVPMVHRVKYNHWNESLFIYRHETLTFHNRSGSWQNSRTWLHFFLVQPTVRDP
jgi:hypothetical protein